MPDKYGNKNGLPKPAGRSQIHAGYIRVVKFELVKSLVLKSMGKSRGGLMLGLANLGNNPQTFLGGFFATG